MRNRATQFKVEDEEDKELLHSLPVGAPKLRHYEHVFVEEEHFPVLLLSFVGPQHGRLFYASVDGGKKLVIRQSKLYSFEKKKNAPLDFFSRILLSRPLHVGDGNSSDSHFNNDVLGQRPSRETLSRDREVNEPHTPT